MRTLYIISKKNLSSGGSIYCLNGPSPTRRERSAHFIKLIDLFCPSHSRLIHDTINFKQQVKKNFFFFNLLKSQIAGM